MSSFPTINAVAGNQIPYGATLCNSDQRWPPARARLVNIVINRYGTTNNAITPDTFSRHSKLVELCHLPLPASCTPAPHVFPGNR